MKRLRIGIVAPSGRIDADVAERVTALAASRPVDLVFHPQCFASHGHFAGTDAERASAFLDVAGDPAIDAVWFARGGYGSYRIADSVVAGLGDAARTKTYVGYSDGGSLLAALYAQGCTVAHGPIPNDIRRDGGEVAVARTLDWLLGDAGAVEPSVGDAPCAAFNITILSHLIGTPHLPDLSGHVLMLEEVSEYMYAIDRALGHITSSAAIRRVAGIRLGRCSLIPENDVDFGADEEAVARHWCAVSGIPWLGRADIGHDIDNRIVPFGHFRGTGR
jgi:muramoyltetrapeptide carboxypeptidase